jgi:asparagine synthase (glutamine-hydrolysing)
MMITISLEFNQGFQWYEKDGIYVKGYVFDKNNTLYRDKGLIEYFVGYENEEGFKKKLKDANGIFSVIVQENDKTLVGIDRTRTFPIFYSEQDADVSVSDNTYLLKNKLPAPQIDLLAQEEFLLTGYVTGENTLLKNVYQIQAGQYAVLGEGVKKESYFTYATSTIVNKPYTLLKSELAGILDEVFGRLIASVNNRTIVIPLSGGYDSRLVAGMLKKLGYENVICFTYGSKDSFEVAYSKKVAGKLGYKHIYVEYCEELFDGFVNDKNYLDYSKFGGNHTSLFLLQDYFAVKYLHDKKMIPTDSIFVPGHSGDFLAGSHITASMGKNAGESRIVNEILKRHYTLKKNASPEKYGTQISQLLNDGFSYSCYEDWDLKERQAKFIVNANKTYEFFGYEHRIPLWDNALIELFKYLDIKYKLKRKFYKNVLEKEIFSQLGIDIGEKYKGNELLQEIKMFIKPYVPKKVFNNYKRKKNLYGFSSVCKQFIDNMSPVDGIDIWNDNSIQAYWYIEKLHDETRQRNVTEE